LQARDLVFERRKPADCVIVMRVLALNTQTPPDLAASIYRLKNCSSPKNARRFEEKSLGGLFSQY
jgi:hypothetical protein